EMEVIESKGGAILVMELEGALFFGSAERLARDIDAALQPADRYLVLDLRRVNEIDSTGAYILLSINAALARNGRHLVLALGRHSETAARLIDLGVLDEVMDAKVFHDVDRAIEWAEDALLREELPASAHEEELALGRVGILAGLSTEDIAAMAPFLRRGAYAKGSVVFREGDPGKELFFIVKGTASAYLHQPNGGDIRLVTFAPGTVFGELAILDAGPRS